MKKITVTIDQSMRGFALAMTRTRRDPLGVPFPDTEEEAEKMALEYLNAKNIRAVLTARVWNGAFVSIVLMP